MLARYIKMQLMVLLCGGLVGPIFLIVYFTLAVRPAAVLDVLCRSARSRC